LTERGENLQDGEAPKIVGQLLSNQLLKKEITKKEPVKSGSFGSTAAQYSFFFFLCYYLGTGLNIEI